MALQFCVATEADLPAIVAMLADDTLGGKRETLGIAVDPAYYQAFAEISADPNNELIIGKMDGPTAASGSGKLIGGTLNQSRDENEVVAVLQLTYIPNLTLKGTKRVQIEGVRVSSAYRGQKIGQQLFDFALQRARDKGCKLAQLTTNEARADAARFYQNLGFRASHVGFKLNL